MSLCTFKLIFYTFSTVWAYTISKDCDWYPTQLLGKGDYRKAFDKFPYADHAPGIALYLQVTMGFHFGSLVKSCLDTKKADFVEMVVHHIATIFLYFSSYIANGLEVATLVALTHDIADITVCGIKVLSESIFKNAQVVFFFVHL